MTEEQILEILETFKLWAEDRDVEIMVAYADRDRDNYNITSYMHHDETVYAVFKQFAEEKATLRVKK